MALNNKSFGQGDPIIILHGLFGTLDNWQTIAKKLAEEYMVYIVDQRNHGRSPHFDEMNYQLMAEDIKAFMEDNWIHHATVLGHSMGGKTAMQLAFDHPDVVEKLIVVDIAPKAYPGGHEIIFEALLALDVQSIENRKEAEAQLATRIEDSGVRQFLLKNLTRSKEGGYQWKMNLPSIHRHYQDILSPLENQQTFDEPTLFIRGGKSSYIQEEDYKVIQEIFPQATIETVAKAGHWVHAEAPSELLSLLLSFLEQ